MTMQLVRAYLGRAPFAPLLVLLIQAGCLCPPCPSTPGALAKADTGAQAVAKSTPVASGSRLVIWDGDKASGGQSWADCTKKPGCKSTLAKAAGVGIDKSAALKFHGEGTDWIGAGWNWANYDASAGTDISQYTTLTFQIRVETGADGAAMDPSSLSILLGCVK